MYWQNMTHGFSGSAGVRGGFLDGCASGGEPVLWGDTRNGCNEARLVLVLLELQAVYRRTHLGCVDHWHERTCA